MFVWPLKMTLRKWNASSVLKNKVYSLAKWYLALFWADKWNCSKYGKLLKYAADKLLRREGEQFIRHIGIKILGTVYSVVKTRSHTIETTYVLIQEKIIIVSQKKWHKNLQLIRVYENLNLSHLAQVGLLDYKQFFITFFCFLSILKKTILSF